MLKPKPARAPQTVQSPLRFSLVSEEAQQQMYRALCALSSNGKTKANASGAEVAEIGVCLAAGESCPLILACAAPGARTVSTAGRVVRATHRRLTSATLAAMDALLSGSFHDGPSHDGPSKHGSVHEDSGKHARIKNARKADTTPIEDAAIVCAGLLDSGPEPERDYRAAFRFAARHKLPILYVIANRLTPGESVPLNLRSLDLRPIYPEFGIPLFTVDANDAIAAYRVATEALHNARHLRGPCVVEALAVTGGASPLELLTAYMERHGNPTRRK